jgi:hypothetical protein
LIALFCYVWLHVSATSRHHQAVKDNLTFKILCKLSLWDPTALLSILLLSYTYVTCSKFYIKSGITQVIIKWKLKFLKVKLPFYVDEVVLKYCWIIGSLLNAISCPLPRPQGLSTHIQHTSQQQNVFHNSSGIYKLLPTSTHRLIRSELFIRKTLQVSPISTKINNTLYYNQLTCRA